MRRRRSGAGDVTAEGRKPPRPAPEPPKRPPEPPSLLRRPSPRPRPGGDRAEGKAGAAAQERAGRPRARGRSASTPKRKKSRKTGRPKCASARRARPTRSRHKPNVSRRPSPTRQKPASTPITSAGSRPRSRGTSSCRRRSPDPEAIFDVAESPTGEIIDASEEVSGNRAYDEVVQRAIIKASPLPRRIHPIVPAQPDAQVRPLDQRRAQDPPQSQARPPPPSLQFSSACRPPASIRRVASPRYARGPCFRLDAASSCTSCRQADHAQLQSGRCSTRRRIDTV